MAVFSLNVYVDKCPTILSLQFTSTKFASSIAGTAVTVAPLLRESTGYSLIYVFIEKELEGCVVGGFLIFFTVTVKCGVRLVSNLSVNIFVNVIYVF